MSIATRIDAIRSRIDAACSAAGRSPTDVRLLAASKTRSAQEVLEARRAGQCLFGENRGQEMRDKPARVNDLLAAEGLSPVEWHFIGALQRNKVKYVVGQAALVHAVDSERLGKALSDRVLAMEVAPIGVLIEVNLGGESAKAGVAPAETLQLAETLSLLPGVTVQGLMTIPPISEDADATEGYFATMAQLRAEGLARGLPLSELSMGMSSDFELAIKHGATIVRVGTAIFGPRPTPL